MRTLIRMFMWLLAILASVDLIQRIMNKINGIFNEMEETAAKATRISKFREKKKGRRASSERKTS